MLPTTTTKRQYLALLRITEMKITDYDLYEAFKAHLNLGDSIDSINSMDIYAAWAVWKAAYNAGYEATQQDGPPCEA